MTQIVRTRAGDMVDALCQQHLGKTAGVTEATYAANPALLHQPLVLPAGLVIRLPAEQPAETNRPNLWD